MSQLSFRLFGSPQIEIDGRPVDFGRHKAMALCAYLAVTAQPHRRDTLATLFWPWQDQSSARASLRRVLHTATRAVGSERFALTRETIGLVQGPDLWVDVLQFRQAVEASGRAPSGQQADAARMGKLSAATDLYRGDFLAGFTLRDTPDFDTWQYITAQDLRRSAVSLLQQLAEFHLECAEFEPAITFAQHWLSLDPLDERAHRTLIRLHAGAGNRTQALHQYDQCCRLLENELGVTPEPETIDLIDDVRTNRFAVASAAESGSSTTPVVELGNADPQTDPQTIPTAAPYPVAQPILSEIRTLTALSLAVEYGEEEVAATSPHAETAGLEEFKQAVHTLSESVDAAIDHLGSDGGLLFFGLSRSHEDDAERALHVAFELVRLAAECHIRIAIGIKSGEASVSGDDLPVVGGSLASRTAMLQRKAALGQVLVDRHTWRRTRDAYHMAPLSTAERAQGVGGPVYIAGGPMAQPLKSRGILGLQSELIGREYELAGLLADCREISDGRGKLVFVIGSAGVGKSRLIGELREALERAAEDDPSPLWLEGRCLEMSMFNRLRTVPSDDRRLLQPGCRC